MADGGQRGCKYIHHLNLGATPKVPRKIDSLPTEGLALPRAAASPMNEITPMSVAQFLRRVPLFTHLSETDIARLAESVRERNYPRNSVILFEDDPGDALYVVVTGQVKVVLIGEDGREVILSVLHEG